MTKEFLAEVGLIVEPLLNELGFQMDGHDDNVDEDGPTGAAVYFRSKDCKIQIYDSRRDASVNCMIAPLDAPNVFGPYDRSRTWQYLVMLAIKQGVPREEVIEDKLPSNFPTIRQRLEWVRGRIKRYFPAARSGILEMNRSEYRNSGH
ncbi:hypothetical protein [Mycobacterium szulgai]|uniref:hypothetical protein n=1 Tax=Mycobacterium szulgai TaxID=1787 RepID=UPI00111C061F|nr:hypothetical protein [Mycobacterium szulgai]MCV7079122.1 hypothetical protein [Mycobacterium szulgai]